MDRINYIRQLNAFWEAQGENGFLKPTSLAVYFCLLQINNICGWKDPFLATFTQVLSMTGIANHKTYFSSLAELVDGGYITWHKSKNQYQAARFSINVLYQNLDMQGACVSHASITQLQCVAHIPKPSKRINNKTKDRDLIVEGFNEFWQRYPYKTAKKDVERKWTNLSTQNRQLILATLDDFLRHKPFDAYRHPNPLTYLNKERWKDELPTNKKLTTSSHNSSFVLGKKPNGSISHM